MTIYPLRLSPVASRRLWGGRKLEQFVGLPDPGAGEPFVESWQVYADNKSLIGPLQGRTLQQAAEQLGPDLLGTRAVARYGSKFPLLVKFLDAAQDLSIQVHPDDSYALTHEADSGHLGKAEAWLILEAEPGAAIWWGLRETVTTEQVRAAVRDGSLTGLLNRVPVRAGDVVYNPPGTVHAVGAGILLYEIQQSSDLTYRLFDFDRRDSEGRPRELHVSRALAVASLSGGQDAVVQPRQLQKGVRELLRCEHFVLQELNAAAAPELRTNPGSVEILTAVSGAAHLQREGGQTELVSGTSLVLPAALGEYALTGNSRVLRAYLPAL